MRMQVSSEELLGSSSKEERLLSESMSPPGDGMVKIAEEERGPGALIEEVNEESS